MSFPSTVSVTKNTELGEDPVALISNVMDVILNTVHSKMMLAQFVAPTRVLNLGSFINTR